MRFEIVEEGERFRIMIGGGALLKSRFHTREQAQAWIDLQSEKEVRSYNARKGHLHADQFANLPALVARMLSPNAGMP